MLQRRPHGEQKMMFPSGSPGFVPRPSCVKKTHARAWSSRSRSCRGAGTAASAWELPMRLLHFAIYAQAASETPALLATRTSSSSLLHPKWNGMDSHGGLEVTIRQTESKKKNYPTTSLNRPLSARNEHQSHPLAGQAQACGRLIRRMDRGPDGTC